MTSPDSPSPRSKAEVVMAEDHLSYGHPLAAWLRHGDLCPARLMAADMASLQGPCDCGLNLAIEAAQEAPAPEGLPGDIFDRLMELWQQPWSELAFGEAQMLVARLRKVIETLPEPTYLTSDE